mgnify:CR=1 FL=1
MDLTDSIAPRSDQMNAEDLLTGPRTFTVTEVRKGSSAEQPVSIYLAEFPSDRPFKPSKTVRRLIVSAWGKESEAYTGRRLTLYRDPDVTFGKDKVGGIRVSHMSHIDKRITLALTTTRGKRAPFIVEPLPDTPAPKATTAGADIDALAKAFEAAGVAQNLWLDYCTNVAGRTITAPTDLTAEEGRKVIDALAQDAHEDGEQE